MQRRAFALSAAALALGACVPRVVRLPHTDGSTPSRGYVLLLRGIGNVFSRGMDTLGQRVAAAGFDAEVRNHSAWQSIGTRLIAEHRAGRLPRPFAIVGHSLGADDALMLAGMLGQAGIATDMVITFDPTWVDDVPRGPRRVINFYQMQDVWGDPLRPGPSFDGELTNINVTDGERIDHFNIHRNPTLHARAVEFLNTLSAAPMPIARRAPIVPAQAPR